MLSDPAQTSSSKVVSALTAARLYYMQDMTMAAIADELNTSRSSVSRLLSYARSSGLVDIRISSPIERMGTIENTIRRRYGISAHVVPLPSTLHELERLQRVALTAGRLIPQWVDSNMVIGIAWGSTLSAVSRQLTKKETQGTAIVQLNGAGNTESSGVDYSSDILQRFGRAFAAQVHLFPVPTFFDEASTRRAMWRERSTQRVLDLQSVMDVAIFSLGSPSAEVPSRVYAGGYLTSEDYSSLEEDKAIGDVATVFFRADGTHAGIRINSRATGPRLSQLRRVPRRVCIVAGIRKLRTLRAAIAAGLVTDVVLDEGLARALSQSR